MGIDLKVLASQFREHRGEFLATATLRFERDAHLLAQFAIDAEPGLAHPLPEGLKIGHYEDDGLKFDTVDRYGAPLTFTTPGDLQNLRLPDDLIQWNRAVLNFLSALPAQTRLVLYWC
jgi:hypothetical protein